MEDNAEKKENEQAELEQQLSAEKKCSEEYLTRLKYLQADFENLKKRYDRQLEQTSKYCTERLVVQLLEVVDELELAVKNSQAQASTEKLVEGVQMTLKKLRKLLEQEGVTPIQSEGKPFDPTKHNAVAAVEREDAEGCVVIEEIRKGYMMKDKVIRPSMVRVASKPSSKSQNMEEKTHE
ncbi:MAG: nucleotide exchange factor GrpE [Candidatus Bathyarchaeia archaeon]